MKITRIIFKKQNHMCKSLATCSIIFEDCLILNEIKLYKNQKGFYLVLPSRQDIFQEFEKEWGISKEPKTYDKYDEFFHPTSSELYKQMLDLVVECYREYKINNTYVYKY